MAALQPIWAVPERCKPDFPRLCDPSALRVCPRPQPGEIFIQSHLVLQHGGLC